MKTTVALCVVLVAISAGAADSGPIVTVTGGQVRGATLAKGGAVFKGIPFAQPPVGELRWREPMPVKPWTGARAATAFGAPCPQSEVPFFPSLGVTSKEDCLSLNIWTSTWPPQGKRAVMVWIPGGGNLLGGNSQALYDGERLARHGVVVVSINYRLGSFGFFAHPALTRESLHHASGNQGLLDQIAALAWVRDNVASFGGDPEVVTIFGASAGSLNAGALMTSPLSKGLFRRVIGQSGAIILGGAPETLAQAEQRGTSMAARWRTPTDASLTDLRAVPMSTVVKADVEASNNLTSTPPNVGITIDGYVLPRPPAIVFATAQEHRVALLLGNNSREHVSATPTDLRTAIEEAYGPLAARALSLYRGAAADSLYGTDTDQWMTDTDFRCSTVAQLAWHAAAGNPAFEYEFARVAPGREALGAMHGAEITYVFGTLDRPLVIPGLPPQGATVVDDQVSDVMQRYWTNFAKTGDPNGDQLPAWPKFEASSRAYIQFTDAGPAVKAGLRRPFCDLFIENLKRLTAK